jgi:hypothetical protein
LQERITFLHTDVVHIWCSEFRDRSVAGIIAIFRPSREPTFLEPSPPSEKSHDILSAEAAEPSEVVMFEVGQVYEIDIFPDGGTEGGIQTFYNLTVVEVEGPLIKVRALAGEAPWIINTHSPAFVSATPTPTHDR